MYYVYYISKNNHFINADIDVCRSSKNNLLKICELRQLSLNSNHNIQLNSA